MRIDIPEVVRSKARVVGAAQWIDDVPDLVASLCREWGLALGRCYDGGTEAFVAAVTRDDGTPAVLKLCVPRGSAASDEIAFLALADGHGCATLHASDVERGALLLEQLGPSLHDLGVPIDERHEIICATVAQLWRPAPDAPFRTGAEKGRWLIDSVTALWDELDHPCTEAAVDHAVACAERRIAAHDDERAVLVHGDAHQWNTLRTLDGSAHRLIDPDGLRAEREYDLAIPMREDADDGDLHERADRLARLTGTDPVAVWEWGAIERVSTGLLGTQIGMEPDAGRMLRAAERIAAAV